MCDILTDQFAARILKLQHLQIVSLLIIISFIFMC